MKRFLIWVVAALPVLLAFFLATGCSEAPPRTPRQTQEEARQAAAAARQKSLAANAERRQNAGSDRSPGAEVHLPPDIPGQDEDMAK